MAWIPPSARPLLGLQQTGDFGPFTIYTSRRRKPVWFLKAPPTKPPSHNQVFQRNRFRMAARAWRQLNLAGRATWHRAARLAGLYINGYHLWIHWQLRRDRAAIATIERRSGVTLIDD